MAGGPGRDRLDMHDSGFESRIREEIGKGGRRGAVHVGMRGLVGMKGGWRDFGT